MMDLPIRLITPELHEQRGAEAFDQGLGQDDHAMNAGSPAIKHWQFGWHKQRIVRSRAQQAVQQLRKVSPP
jgi:hypothetical protein